MKGRADFSDRSSLVPRPLDFVFGVGIWVAATAALVLSGNLVLPGADARFAAALAYTVICAATFGATGLRFGAVVLVMGLFLDGLLLAVTGFAYPGADAARTETIAVVFLLAYPLAVVGPWLVGLHAETRRS